MFKSQKIMRFNQILFLSLLLLAAIFLSSSLAKEDDEISWQRVFSEEIFKKAEKENKFVILDLEAVWCHWCHVMHEKTYTDHAVINLIRSKFIPVRIDHDLRPDLANKYRDYGWPATIVLNSKGEEIIKRAGYITPDEMKLELEKVIEDPTPEEPEIDESNIRFSSGTALSKELKEELIKRHKNSFDQILGGLKLNQKFIDRDSLEYSLIQAEDGNHEEEEMARKTLDAALKLIDPAWGGVYQYSTMG